MPTTPQISVLMAVHNGAGTLEHQLGALAGQLGRDAEAVFVDDRSTDGSRALLAAFAERTGQARWVRNDRAPGKASAINLAAGHSTGRVLVILDQDDAVRPDYLRLLAEAALEHGLAFGRMEYEALNDPDVRAALWDHPDQDRTRVRLRRSGAPSGADPVDGAVRVGSGACVALRRDLFDRLGGLALDVGCTDDVDLCLRAAELGHPYRQFPQAVVSYRFRSGCRALFRQRLAYGRAWCLLEEKYRHRGIVVRSTPRSVRDLGIALRKLLSFARGRRLQGAAELGFSSGLILGRAARRTGRGRGTEGGGAGGPV